MRETFILRTEWKDAIFELTIEEQAAIFQNLFHYHSENQNQINLNNPSVKLVWRLLEPNLKRNIDYYDKRKETSKENGKLGGRPLKDNELEKPKNLTPKPKKPKKPNVTLSDTDSVTDSDNNKNGDKPPSLHSKLKSQWLGLRPDYVWGAIDGKMLNDIVSKLKVSVAAKNGGEPTEDKILEGFIKLINNLPNWYVAKDLKTISGGYNTIIEEIKKNTKEKLFTQKMVL